MIAIAYNFRFSKRTSEKVKKKNKEEQKKNNICFNDTNQCQLVIYEYLSKHQFHIRIIFRVETFEIFCSCNYGKSGTVDIGFN